MDTFTSPSMQLRRKRTTPPRSWPVGNKRNQRIPQQRQQHLKQMASRCRSWHKEKSCINQSLIPAAHSAVHFVESVLTHIMMARSPKLRAHRDKKASAKQMWKK